MRHIYEEWYGERDTKLKCSDMIFGGGGNKRPDKQYSENEFEGEGEVIVGLR